MAASFDPLVVFEQERRRLFGVAYRMLGMVGDAEDVLQDAYVRWHNVDHATVEQPTAYLVRMVTRLCLDVLGSARQQRTSYIGPWLPEPLVAPLGDDPAAIQEAEDDLSLAFLLLLERLTPLERAVFLLRESFDFRYGEIGGIIDKTEEHCRQLAKRARQRLGEASAAAGSRGAAAPIDRVQHQQLLFSFLQAVNLGDVQGLIELLARDVVTYSDGGGKVAAAPKPIEGAERVANLMVTLRRKAASLEAHLGMINGLPGLITLINGQLNHVLSIHVADGRIQAIHVVLNPDKLARITLPEA